MHFFNIYKTYKTLAERSNVEYWEYQKFIIILIILRFPSIPSYRIPQDAHKLKLWEKSIASHAQLPLSGFVCFKHFWKNDLIPETKSKPITLRKNSVPTVFELSTPESLSEPNENVDIENELDDFAHHACEAGLLHRLDREDNGMSEVNEAIAHQNVYSNDPCESCHSQRIQYEDLCNEMLIE